MRPKHLKFHAAAIGAICIVITVLFMLVGPTEPAVAPGEIIGDRFIQIDNATWGKNCDSFVTEAIATWKVPAPDEKDPAPRPSYAQYNNVLPLVSTACNGKLDCTVPTTVEALKIDPLKSCFKRLVVGYRCFTYDRLTTLDIGEGDAVTINCRENAKPPEQLKQP